MAQQIHSVIGVRVLVVTTDFPPAPGGIQTVLFKTISHFQSFEPIVVAPDHPHAEVFDRGAPFEIHRVPLGIRGSSRPARWADLALLIGLSQAKSVQLRPNVLLCGHPFVSMVGWARKKTRKTPYAVCAYGRELLVKRRLLRTTLNGAGAIFSISRHTDNLLHDIGVLADRIVRLPLAPDAPIQESGNFGSGTMVTAARMDDLYKGHDVMIRAMPLVLAKVPKAHWVVIGGGTLRSYYERLATSLGVSESITFAGHVSRAERDRLLAQADVMVMPSRDRQIDGGAEGFGLAYIEAGAAGKPVVGGRAGGVPDAVIDGVTGVLVDPEDPLEVAEAVIGMLKDLDRSKEMGENGRKRVEENLSWERSANIVEENLIRLLGSR